MKYNKKVKVILIVAALFLLAAAFTAGFAVNQRLRNSTSLTVTMKDLMNELAENDICYVIGHKSPDTDTVCSAILLSDIAKECGIKCEARISGNINNETKFILETHRNRQKLTETQRNSQKLTETDRNSQKLIETDRNG